MKAHYQTYYPAVLDLHLNRMRKDIDDGIPTEFEAYLDGLPIVPRTNDYDTIFDGLSEVEQINDHLMIRVYSNPNTFNCEKYIYTPKKEEVKKPAKLPPEIQQVIEENGNLKLEILRQEKEYELLDKKLGYLTKNHDLLAKKNSSLKKKIKRKNRENNQLLINEQSLQNKITNLENAAPKNDINGLLNGLVEAVAKNPDIINVFKKEQPLSGVDVLKKEDTIDHFISQHFTEEESNKVAEILLLLSKNKKMIDAIYKYTHNKPE